MPNIVDLRELNEEKNEQQEKEPRESGENISWRTLEYEHYRKSKDWFWALFIVMAALLIVAIITKNFLFGVFIIIAGIAMALLGKKRPREVEVVVSGKGVQIENNLYPYETLESFWIFYQPPDIKEVSLKSEKLLMPHIKIPLGDTDPTSVRKLLLQFLPEEAQEESLIDVVARMLKF